VSAHPLHAARTESADTHLREQGHSDDLQADRDFGLSDPPVGRAVVASGEWAGVSESAPAPPPGGSVWPSEIARVQRARDAAREAKA
jgi:hypothetical protein